MAGPNRSARIAYRLASRQHGVFSRRQLIAHGITRGQIARWIRNGRVIQVFGTVYALGRPAVHPESLMMAAALAGGRDAAITGRAGAAAWGFGEPPAELEVIRPFGASRVISGIPPHERLRARVHRGLLLPPERCRIGPLPVASPDQVLARLAAQVSDPELRRYFLEAGRTDHLTLECLDRLGNPNRRFKGRARLLRMARIWDPTKGKIRSMLEGEFRLMCGEQGVPLPETNQLVGPYEVDCLWRDARVIVELDGRRFHGDAFAHAEDAAKTRALRAMGYVVLRFTWEEVTGQPEIVAARILEALAQRA